MLRLRTRSASYKHYHQNTRTGSIIGDASGSSVRESFYDHDPGPGSCDHVELPLCSCTAAASDESRFVISGQPLGPTDIVELEKQVYKHLYQLNWDKLPTSNQAGIIQILAEMDETLDLLLGQSLSYGAFRWGVKPLLSDLKAAGNTLKKLSQDLSDFYYADEYIVPVRSNVVHPTSNWFIGGEGLAYIRQSGRADMSFQHPGAILLDRLGFHPDIATAWDLVPYSFVLDYIYPISDYLESFRLGGWVKAIFLVGWLTIKWDLKLTIYNSDPAYRLVMNPFSSLIGNYSRFQRWPIMATLTPPPAGDLPVLERPTLREAFDTAYLAAQRAKIPGLSRL